MIKKPYYCKNNQKNKKKLRKKNLVKNKKRQRKRAKKNTKKKKQKQQQTQCCEKLRHFNGFRGKCAPCQRQRSKEKQIGAAPDPSSARPCVAVLSRQSCGLARNASVFRTKFSAKSLCHHIPARVAT